MLVLGESAGGGRGAVEPTSEWGTEGTWFARVETLDVAELDRYSGTEPLFGLALVLVVDPPVGLGEMPFMPDNDALDPWFGIIDIDGGRGRLGRHWWCKSWLARRAIGDGGTAGQLKAGGAPPPPAAAAVPLERGGAMSRLMRLDPDPTSIPCPLSAFIRSAIEPPCSWSTDFLSTKSARALTWSP